jgi:hypothetical protein
VESAAGASAKSAQVAYLESSGPSDAPGNFGINTWNRLSPYVRVLGLGAGVGDTQIEMIWVA